MTPLQIEILLHYYTTPTDYRDGDFFAPSVREAIDDFRKLNILVNSVKSGVNYALSEGGQRYVERLCSVPLPQIKECWVFPDGYTEAQD